MADTATLSNYGGHFQEHIVYLLLTDKKYAEEMYEIFDSDYLDLTHLKYIVQEYFDYRGKFNLFPSVNIFREILSSKKNVNPSVQEKTNQFFTLKFHPGDNEYVIQKTTDFCRVQKIKTALLQIIELCKKPNIENIYPEIEEAIKNALRFGSDKDVGMLYNNLTLLDDRLKAGAIKTVSTGWPKLDELFKGGIGIGELIVILAVTGKGKSHWLINLGSNLVKQGKTVLHYTLELSTAVTALRYDSNISNIPIDDIPLNKDIVQASISNVPGTLIIKEYPTKSVTFNTIKNHYLKTVSGLNLRPDLVIIDYADLLKPVSKSERRLELEDVYQTIRGFAMEQQIAVATASQVHRSAVEDEIISIATISEAFAKVMISDIVLSLSRRIQDEAVGQGKLFLAKSRRGPDGIVLPVSIDTTRSLIQPVD